MKTAVRVGRYALGRLVDGAERRGAAQVVAALLDRAYRARALANQLPRRQGALSHE